MTTEKFDETLGIVAAKLIERTKGECPCDEEFALYREGKLRGDRRKAIISHFVSCSECRERLAIPITQLDVLRRKYSIRAYLTPIWRPLVLVPVAIVFLAVAAVTLNVYLESRGVKEEVYRGGNLVALQQVDLTPSLLRIIKEGNEAELKNELIKNLPIGAVVSTIVVQQELKSLKAPKEVDKVILILYGDGILKIKLEK
jgi:hypothetical protein